MPRAVAEWRGKTPDTPAPPRVRLRVFQRENGVCYLSGRKIQPGEPWQLEHKIALINGGENRETNLFPALVDKHKEKTRADLAEKSKVADKAKKHVGAVRPTGRLKGRGFPAGKNPRPGRAALAPRQLFEGE